MPRVAKIANVECFNALVSPRYIFLSCFACYYAYKVLNLKQFCTTICETHGLNFKYP